MAETFYGVLGVTDDADNETIRRAYREQVKEHHPDVSDDPDAPEQFKRLTTARDVLVDADERTRYDRLGHTEYVEKHVDSPVWDQSETESTDGHAETTTTATTQETGPTNTTDGGYDRTAWLGDDNPGKRRQRHRQRRQQAHAAGATAAAEEWQHASKTYRRADTDVTAGQQSPVRSLVTALRSVGPWLIVHLVFIGSAAATSWLAFSQLATYASVSWPTLLLGFVVVGMTIFASTLHVISQLYS